MDTTQEHGLNALTCRSGRISFAALCLYFIVALEGCNLSEKLWPAMGLAMQQQQVAGHAAPKEREVELYLRIETGMHTAPIEAIGIDTANRYVVTGSHDGTLRLWEQTTGRLVRVLRPSIGAGHEGQINAAAISPDGTTVVCGGYTGTPNGGYAVYLFDVSSGKIRRRIGGLYSVINYLAYSRDGRLIVIGLLRGGIRIYRTDDNDFVDQDSDYGSAIYGLDLDATGRLITSSFDGFIRLYKPAEDGRLYLMKKEKAPGGARPWGVKFSPDGQKVAVGYFESPRVDVLSSETLSPIYSPEGSGITGDLREVAWSADGQRLYAAGTHFVYSNYAIRIWSDGGRGQSMDVPSARSTISGLAPLQDGGVLFASMEPAWGRLELPSGSMGAGLSLRDVRARVIQKPAIADFRNNARGLLLSDNGATIQFKSMAFGRQPIRFSALDRQMGPPSWRAGLVIGSTPIPGDYSTEGLSAPVISAPGLAITNWDQSFEPKLNGERIPLRKDEAARSLAIAPDHQTFVLGTEHALWHYSRTGHFYWRKELPGIAWALNISPNGLLVVALGNGTIQWHRLKDGEHLLTLYPHEDGNRWVLWASSGYYAASIGGEELVGWHLNRGKDHAADFYPISHFRDAYYRPDVIAKVLQALDVQEAVLLADAEAGRTQPAASITEQLPPVVNLAGRSEVIETQSDTVTVRVTVRSPSGAPITKYRIFIDGREAPLPKGPATGPEQPARELEEELLIPVPARDATVTIRAENEFGASEPVTVAVRWTGTAVPEELPDLYVLAVGINYKTATGARTAFTLDYAEADAEAFVATMRAQEGRRYRKVHEKLLTNEDATRDAILEGLTWLKTNMIKSTDVGMLFLSGHGMNEGNAYYFLPLGADRQKLLSTAVPGTTIAQVVAELRGTKLVFVDTCRSGNVDIVRLANELYNPKSGGGAAVITSSTGTQASLEHKDWGHGAFTKVLIEGLQGKADLLKTGDITVTGLSLFVTDEVKRLTGKQQTPTSAKPGTVPDDFLVAKRG